MTLGSDRARERRQQKTTSEGLLWHLLRGRQVSGLKFRREHKIGPWIADFACIAKQLVVEVDGGYHDQTAEKDLRRQRDLERLGWKVVRYTAEDVERDAEAVVRAIATEAGLDFEYIARKNTGSGMLNVRAKQPKNKKIE